MVSKRLALRFPCNRLPLRFKTAYDDGEGWLLNVSTDGCAFSPVDRLLTMGEKILVSIELQGENEIFQARGEVARIDAQGLAAVRFTLAEPEAKALLRRYFTRLRRD